MCEPYQSPGSKSTQVVGPPCDNTSDAHFGSDLSGAIALSNVGVGLARTAIDATRRDFDATTRLSHCNDVSERSVLTTSLLFPSFHDATRLDIDIDVSERSVSTTSLLCPSCHNAIRLDIDATTQLSHCSDMPSCHSPPGLHVHPDFLLDARMLHGPAAHPHIRDQRLHYLF